MTRTDQSIDKNSAFCGQFYVKFCTSMHRAALALDLATFLHYNLYTFKKLPYNLSAWFQVYVCQRQPKLFEIMRCTVHSSTHCSGCMLWAWTAWKPVRTNSRWPSSSAALCAPEQVSSQPLGCWHILGKFRNFYLNIINFIKLWRPISRLMIDVKRSFNHQN